MKSLFLLDSDCIVDVLKTTDAADWLKSLSLKGTLSFSVVNEAEIYAGLRPEDEAAVGKFFDALQRIPIDGEMARLAGGYRQRYGQSHGVLLPDALIAAAAVQTGAVLVTRNSRHYPMPQIKLLVPNYEGTSN